MSQWEKARDFYSRLCPFLGMTKVYDGNNFLYHVGGRTALGIQRCAEEFADERFRQNRVGLHHACFRARNREDVDKAAEAIASADVLLLQLEIPLESVHRAAQIAQEQGVKVVLNPAPAQPLAADLLSSINYLIPNESESSTLLDALTDAPTGTAIDTPTGELSDLPATGPEEMLTSMAKLRTIGVNTVILTAGEQGVFLAEAGSNRHFPAFSLEQVVDTTAAGDAFVGGLATAIAEGKPLSEAILWGNAAGMLAVTRAGAQPSLPSRAEVEALLVEATAEQRQGVRM